MGRRLSNYYKYIKKENYKLMHGTEDSRRKLRKLYSGSGYVIDTLRGCSGCIRKISRRNFMQDEKLERPSSHLPQARINLQAALLAAIAPEYDTLPVLEQVAKLLHLPIPKFRHCDGRNPYCTGASYDRV